MRLRRRLINAWDGMDNLDRASIVSTVLMALIIATLLLFLWGIM